VVCVEAQRVGKIGLNTNNTDWQLFFEKLLNMALVLDVNG